MEASSVIHLPHATWFRMANSSPSVTAVSPGQVRAVGLADGSSSPQIRCTLVIPSDRVHSAIRRMGRAVPDFPAHRGAGIHSEYQEKIDSKKGAGV